MEEVNDCTVCTKSGDLKLKLCFIFLTFFNFLAVSITYAIPINNCNSQVLDASKQTHHFSYCSLSIDNKIINNISTRYFSDSQMVLFVKRVSLFGEKHICYAMRENRCGIDRTSYEATINGTAKLMDLNKDGVNELIIKHKLIEADKTIYIDIVLMKNVDKIDTILIRKGFSSSLPANNMDERFEPGDLLSTRYFLRFKDKDQDGDIDIRAKEVITRFKAKKCSCDDHFNYKISKIWLINNSPSFPAYKQEFF